MYQLSDQQVDHILADLRRRGIETESMCMNLLDHICILIENNLAADGDFDQFYAAAIRSFYKEELCELEEEARLLMSFRRRHILVSRNQFFLLLFGLLIGPFIAYDLLWYVQSGPAVGWVFPQEIWLGTLVFAAFPLLFLLVLYTTPERFDPLIPRRSRILLGFHPLIRILPMDMA